MKPLIIEFIGTFFLVLVVALTGNPIAIGAVLVAMVYMGGYISGAHYNPAVTAAFLATRKFDLAKAINYWIAQILGGSLASLTFLLVKSSYFTPAPGKDVNFFSALLIEIIFTFALVNVVLHTAATDKTKGNDYFGLAIGLTVMAGAFAAGPISGAAFNPAVGAVPLLYNLGSLFNNLPNILLYILGPLGGAALASFAYLQKD